MEKASKISYCRLNFSPQLPLGGCPISARTTTTSITKAVTAELATIHATDKYRGTKKGREKKVLAFKKKKEKMKNSRGNDIVFSCLRRKILLEKFSIHVSWSHFHFFLSHGFGRPRFLNYCRPPLSVGGCFLPG